MLSGIALVVADLINFKIGFGFSAGLIDYLVAYPLSTNALLVIPAGIVFAIVYFALFGVSIRTLDLPTPGRASRAEREEAARVGPPTAQPA